MLVRSGATPVEASVPTEAAKGAAQAAARERSASPTDHADEASRHRGEGCAEEDAARTASDGLTEASATPTKVRTLKISEISQME